MNKAPPSGLIEHAKQRSLMVFNKLKSAINEIEVEIDANEGIYPYNGGKISQAELCRRAKINQVTLSTAAHRNTTRPMVEEWLTRIHNATISGRKSVRRAVTDRAEEWKSHHQAIAENYRIAELEMLDMRKNLRRLENENTALRDRLASYENSKILTPNFSKK
ncbi:hypothetical protein [Pseudomonas frederiksbergensis]|uniref:Uncharacterized protein n=1 Tax=Pseudomonas frederiksbergensis TaxID=104087 RepID=A0A423KNN0_9PSED|nr:hypothetical protein [Pseudomonas frederiksbergensis]RON55995.1 hypothetical protein BK665_08540 [Pseudomonas frederiksbergensis]